MEASDRDAEATKRGVEASVRDAEVSTPVCARHDEVATDHGEVATACATLRVSEAIGLYMADHDHEWFFLGDRDEL